MDSKAAENAFFYRFSFPVFLTARKACELTHFRHHLAGDPDPQEK
jgi:hypothetical protein